MNKRKLALVVFIVLTVITLVAFFFPELTNILASILYDDSNTVVDGTAVFILSLFSLVFLVVIGVIYSSVYYWLYDC
jgi:hypothetical protein